VHLFHDGEISGALRDLVDIDGMIRTFAEEETFWEVLTSEAVAMDATRALYYSLRYSRMWLHTPIPQEVSGHVDRWAPLSLVRRAMDALVSRALFRPLGASGAATFMLRARGHCLRMPLGMLLRHLSVKTVRRWRHGGVPLPASEG
jgi:hypothetical protein